MKYLVHHVSLPLVESSLYLCDREGDTYSRFLRKETKVVTFPVQEFKELTRKKVIFNLEETFDERYSR